MARLRWVVSERPGVLNLVNQRAAALAAVAVPVKTEQLPISDARLAGTKLWLNGC